MHCVEYSRGAVRRRVDNRRENERHLRDRLVAGPRGREAKNRHPLPLDGRRWQFQLAVRVRLQLPAGRADHGGEEEGALLESGRDRDQNAFVFNHSNMGQ